MPPRLGLFFPPSKVRDGVHPTRRLDLFFFFFSPQRLSSRSDGNDGDDEAA